MKNLHSKFAFILLMLLPLLGMAQANPFSNALKQITAQNGCQLFIEATTYTDARTRQAESNSHSQINWSGSCVNGFASGDGVLSYVGFDVGDAARQTNIYRYKVRMESGYMNGNGVMEITYQEDGKSKTETNAVLFKMGCAVDTETKGFMLGCVPGNPSEASNASSNQDGCNLGTSVANDICLRQMKQAQNECQLKVNAAGVDAVTYHSCQQFNGDGSCASATYLCHIKVWERGEYRRNPNPVTVVGIRG